MNHEPETMNHEPSTMNQDPTILIDPVWFEALGGLDALVGGGVRHQVDADGVVVIPLKWRKAERGVLKKKKFIAPSVWAEKHRYLTSRARHAGRWDNATVPYLAGIMDASFFNGVEEIGIMAVPQSGKTEAVYTCLGYATDQRPGDAMICFPSEKDATDNAKDRLKPMYQESPRLRRHLTGYMDDLGAHKMTLANMIIYMAWANSPSRLSNRPCMYGYADEEDKHPATASKKEGAAIDLLKKRTNTFSGLRKIWRTSSCSTESGPIWRYMENEAHAVYDYWVRCPECGGWQLMEFKRIKWTEGERDPRAIEDTRDVWYECAKCDARWDDHVKRQAVRDGMWRDRKTGLSLFASLESRQPLRIGFDIPAWISPFILLYEIAAAFLKGLKGQPDWRTKLIDFKNGFENRPWRATEAVRAENAILALADDRPRGVVPSGGVVACLLAGVDTQDDGFYYEIRAFGYGMEKESWGVQEGKVPTFAALEQILWQNEYRDSDGVIYPVRLTMQDSAGHRTSEVYDFCRLHRGRIFPTKGMRTMASPYTFKKLDYMPNGKPIPGGVRFYRLDTNYYKNMLSGMLEIAPGDPGCWWYHGELTIDWARQMVAEGMNEKGFWENIQGRPNHAWDCAVLLLMAHDMARVATWKKPDTAPRPPRGRKAPAAEKVALW